MHAVVILRAVVAACSGSSSNVHDGHPSADGGVVPSCPAYADRCVGRMCGDAGFASACGTCPTGTRCGLDGQPSCGSAVCGDDGCGGTCGTCASGTSAFTIPVELQELHGYPALTDAIKAKILGLNSAKLYGIDPAATRCAIENDDISKRKRELDRASPRLRAYGPQSRREFFAFLRQRDGQPG